MFPIICSKYAVYLHVYIIYDLNWKYSIIGGRYRIKYTYDFHKSLLGRQNMIFNWKRTIIAYDP